MAERKMAKSDLVPELRDEALKPSLRKGAELLARRVRRVRYYRRNVDEGITLMDISVLTQVFVAHVANNKGLRIASLTRILAVPRSTVTKSVGRLVEAELLMRDERREYWLAEDLAVHANGVWDELKRSAINLALEIEKYIDRRKKK